MLFASVVENLCWSMFFVLAFAAILVPKAFGGADGDGKIKAAVQEGLARKIGSWFK
ncbi:hypothetical protein [Zavarzinella formosa]|uniref:hypothetical protein n=1 Tax=Zavarzinella formosa TaxID=360055 RepID=UPI0002FCA7CF|nr:hypothetical protein [Zavarzinella formosa]